jgi:oxalate---CoA ligase
MKCASETEARADLEAHLLDLWSRYLKVDGLSVHDDFFEKGGDSLLATEMVMELEKLSGRALPQTTIFEFPTIRELADNLVGDRDHASHE